MEFKILYPCVLGSFVQKHKIFTRYCRIWNYLHRRESNLAATIHNPVIERGLISRPDTKFSLACDSLKLYAYIEANHRQYVDTRRTVIACIFYLLEH